MNEVAYTCHVSELAQYFSVDQRRHTIVFLLDGTSQRFNTFVIWGPNTRYWHIQYYIVYCVNLKLSVCVWVFVFMCITKIYIAPLKWGLLRSAPNHSYRAAE